MLVNEHVLTVEFLATLVALASPGAVLCFTLWRGIAGVARTLDAFKLEVAKSYASLRHLEEVEDRLVKAIDRLDQSMQALPAQIAAIRYQAPGARCQHCAFPVQPDC